MARQAAAHPHRPAVVCGTETLTYTQLENRAEDFARRLRDAGVGHGDVVGVLAHRSTALIVTLLAVLKAGAAYLVVDPGEPDGRCARLLEDAGAGVVVAEEEREGRVPPHCRLLGMPGPDEPAERPEAAAPPAGHPDQLAYVSYTSGSTGEPKGVGVPHRAVARLLYAPDWMEIHGDDVFLELAPVAFDASTIEIWGPLVNGARLVVHAGRTVELDQLAKEIQQEGVTVLLLTTGLFNQMVTQHLEAFEGVRHVLTGGDVASASHVRRLMDAYPGLLFTNGYGPTENTSFTTCWTTDTPPAADESVPIGRPIKGTRIAILDAELRPVPDGETGELYTSGDGLARGYVGRPGATAERFVADPYAPEPGARMYRTGDLVRRRPDGLVEFLGRADQQVKIRGFRVEPGHVEAVLTRYPEVRDAVVVPQADASGNKRLLAYVLPEPEAAEAATAAPDGAAGLAARLREALSAELPPHLVPWAVLLRPELPLNRNGKVDRKALPATTRVARGLGTPLVLPRTPLEERLAALWGEVLGVEPVGVRDDFFALGGHSLLAAQLIAALRRETGQDVSARTLYLRPTIEELAAELS
ncbi:phenylalanine racemase [Streptomyces venezuelae]|uniref:non-ribosomal peptide synthetase n=1 Tax=Streptomyces venezuelae TaxID=54571 RepID=UPI00123D315F|nr:non-ribosomal peptide synthetase [Streptomyces venezuelae]QES12045.1 phenylalanine racemase [Streptomyces venezuelae]